MVYKRPRTFKSLFDYKNHTNDFSKPTLTPVTSLYDLYIETKTITPLPLIEKIDTNSIPPPSPRSISKPCLRLTIYPLFDTPWKILSNIDGSFCKSTIKILLS